jgi:hypothetical protein
VFLFWFYEILNRSKTTNSKPCCFLFLFLLFLLLLLLQAGESLGRHSQALRNVGTMVLDLLLLLLKLTFILGIVSSVFFQGRSRLRLPHPRKAAGAQITQSRHGEVVTLNNDTGLLQVW